MRTTHKIFRIIGVLLVLLAIVLVIIAVNNDNTDSGTTMLIVGCLIAFVGSIMAAIAGHNLDKYCSKCGAKLTGCEYSYQEKRRRPDKDGNLRSVEFRVEAVCPSCGTTKQLSTSVTVNNGENPQYLIDRYCERMFR